MKTNYKRRTKENLYVYVLEEKKIYTLMLHISIGGPNIQHNETLKKISLDYIFVFSFS